MRLLIVEDDDRWARYLVRGLSESGHIVDRAADGETGLALALEGIYDVLIVDRRLPTLDGTHANATTARTGHRHADLSAECPGCDDRDLMRAGCAEVLAGWKVLRDALTRRAREAVSARCRSELDTQARRASRAGQAIVCSTASSCCWSI